MWRAAHLYAKKVRQRVMAIFYMSTSAATPSGHVWLCIPSKRPTAEANATLAIWRDRGYCIALFCDSREEVEGRICDAYICDVPYPGYAQAVNLLVKGVLLADHNCDWVVTGGDDTEPDATHSPEEIASQCSGYFGIKNKATAVLSGDDFAVPHSTFGICQPTGDRFAQGSIDRICGSPWMGREWCERINGGTGPLWHEYVGFFSDEELQNVALRLGVLWQRRDLTHLHCHYQRESRDVNANAVSKPMPQFSKHLHEVYSRPHWDKYQAIFNARKAANFPGHEPLPRYASGGDVERGTPSLVGEHDNDCGAVIAGEC